ncbi:ABC transporter permease [Actinobacteria bacterium YIM 96077]|uniref:ABC transporter permease n=1 Tax=Phytoactinopolyspora halophila TaxID=1981511 RepID=A0A329R6W0_9ACTN|nr:ABC transporter permease [Phytoactinopolyspora halophila]AYY11968.1 ABC transporter permease [Actinobacteria bacterium YIM 96077]RAW18798.1 ABC transporter permease [Phytoactinopolyspora halophila]
MMHVRTSARTGYVRFVVRRLVLAPLILLGVSFTVFVVVDLSPNDPARAVLGLFADAEQRARFAAEHGLNDPLPVRFARFVGDVAQFRLGESVVRPESVNELIGLAFPITVQLMLLATLIAVTSALILGITAAQMEGRWPDRVIGTAAAIFQAAPQFWVGLMFIQLFAVTWGWLPSGGYAPPESGFTYWFSSMIGPAVVLALPFAAAMTRVIRASVADELAKDYVRTALGAGVPGHVVLIRNVLRNALVTPITVLGVYVGLLMSGAILVETVFNLPGMGTLLVTGVQQGDLGVVRGVAIVGAAAFVLINLVVDLLYLLLNPRSAEVAGR